MRRYWPQLTIVLAACLFCWPVFMGRIMSPADMLLLMLPWKHLAAQFPGFTQPHNPMLDPIQQYLPWRIYAVESVRAGLIPLWNPYAFLGTPFLANLQSTLLYPPNLIFLVTGAAYGFGVSAIFHLALGGLLMFAFLRTLDLRAPAALLGALVFMFNGYTVSWLEYPTLSLWTFMWLPGILLCYERALRRPVSVWPVLCALLVGLQFLGGHLQISAYLMLAFFIYAITRAIALRRPLLAMGLCALPIICGLALAAGQILPTLELTGYSGRISRGPALSTAFPLTHFVLYFMPNFFGNPAHYNYWGNLQQSAVNYFETAAYVGLLPLLLAVWSFRRCREPAFWFFGALTIVAVLAAIGSPLYLLLYYTIPGFHELAGLGRILCLAAFGIAGLAALGADELLTRTTAGKLGRAVPVAAAAFAVLALICSVVYEVPLSELGSRYQMYELVQALVFGALTIAGLVLIQARAKMRLRPQLFGGLACGLVALDLFGFGIGFNPFVSSKLAYPSTDSIRWLQQHAGHDRITSLAPDDPRKSLDWMPHNAPMVFGLRDIHGSDSLRVATSFGIVSPPNGDQSRYPDANSPLLNNLGVRYLVTDRELPGKWKRVGEGELPIYENTQAQPRIRVAGGASSVTITRDGADAQQIKVTGAAPGARLVVMDSYYPGWRAQVDGKPANIDNAGGFRAVALSPGDHTVEMRYQPASFRVGLYVSLLAGLSLLGSGAALFVLSRASAADTAARSYTSKSGASPVARA